MPDTLPPTLDALTAASGGAGATPPAASELRRSKKIILVVGGIVYAGFILWCLMLLALLPNPTGEGRPLVSFGLLTSLGGVILLLGVGAFGLKRISHSSSSIATRRRSLLKFIALLLPGIALGMTTPLLIIREPALPMDIVEPTGAADFVAPVAVTLSVERSAGILRNLGMKALRYEWDTDGDGKMNDETVVPQTTVVYERQGIYTPVVRIRLDGGGIRRIVRRVAIPQAVFSMTPVRPIVERAVKFSVATLLTDPKQLKQVQWDFGDGTPLQTVTIPDIVHTYYVTGAYPISATVQLLSQSQTTYKRTVAVTDPPPLPFPVTLLTEPQTLVGPPPFGVLFRLDTKEELRDVAWSFGDGKEDRGVGLMRQSHAYEAPGIYPVVVRARSATGSLAELTTLVRVTETLILRDLRFTGSPSVLNAKMSGEVPLEFSLTPKTSTPLVEFSWDIPSALPLTVKDGALTGTLRKEGSYSVTLLAQGAEGKSVRMPMTIEVTPPSAEPSIRLSPDGGTAPLTVTFDASQSFIPPGATVAGFKWLFGDEPQGGRNPQLGAARVQHTFASAGEYTVKLSIVLTSGKEFTAQRTLIVRRPNLSPCITASRLSVQVGKGVEFDSSCSAGEWKTLLWDVRSADDPKTVLAQSEDSLYVYVFSSSGEFVITLQMTDALGNVEQKSVSISVTP